MALRIGEFLVSKGVLTPAQVDLILEHGKRSGLRFGEAGLDLGLLSEQKLIEVFGKNYRVDFFHLDFRYFPKETKDLLPVSDILRYGALPLGSKTEYRLFRKGRILNFGMIDPGRTEAIMAIEAITQKNQALGGRIRLKCFLVLADEFLGILQSVYNVDPLALKRELHGPKRPELDQTLEMFIEGFSAGSSGI